MWGDMFLKMTRFPLFRRIVWKPIYEFTATVIPTREFRFMNYGYTPNEDEGKIELRQEDEVDRYCIQLYHFLAVRTEIKGKHVLEVGSGRGGGSAYIYNYLHPTTMTGLDLAGHAVSFANQNWAHGGLRYLQGNAESIPLGDDSMDVVINVESSHAYGSFPKFVSEVHRVLKPGGIFLITDMRLPVDLKTMQYYLASSGMDILEELDITSNVVQAIESDEENKEKRIQALVPSWLKPAIREFSGVRESAIHRHMRDRDRLYYRWMLRKKTEATVQEA